MIYQPTPGGRRINQPIDGHPWQLTCLIQGQGQVTKVQDSVCKVKGQVWKGRKQGQDEKVQVQYKGSGTLGARSGSRDGECWGVWPMLVQGIATGINYSQLYLNGTK